jgi:hypothetical protein
VVPTLTLGSADRVAPFQRAASVRSIGMGRPVCVKVPAAKALVGAIAATPLSVSSSLVFGVAAPR